MARARAARLSVDERRARLIELGVAVFSECPYDGISTDAIAERAGVSKGLLYHYFDGKRGFYVETMKEVARQIIAATEPASDVPVDIAIRGAVEGFLNFVAENSSIYLGLLRGGIGADVEVQRIIEEVRATSSRRLLDRLGVEEPSATLRTAMYGWIGFTEACGVDWVSHGRELSPAQMMTLMLEALAPVLRLAAMETANDH